MDQTFHDLQQLCHFSPVLGSWGSLALFVFRDALIANFVMQYLTPITPALITPTVRCSCANLSPVSNSITLSYFSLPNMAHILFPSEMTLHQSVSIVTSISSISLALSHLYSAWPFHKYLLAISVVVNMLLFIYYYCYYY